VQCSYPHSTLECDCFIRCHCPMKRTRFVRVIRRRVRPSTVPSLIVASIRLCSFRKDKRTDRSFTSTASSASLRRIQSATSIANDAIGHVGVVVVVDAHRLVEILTKTRVTPFVSRVGRQHVTTMLLKSNSVQVNDDRSRQTIRKGNSNVTDDRVS
jgi:hypothetical protein